MIGNNPALTSSLRFAADGHAVSAAMQLARDFIVAAKCGPETEAKLLIIIEELVANVIEHGKVAPDSDIALALSADSAEIRVALSDAGVAFDPCQAPAPGDAPPERGGGAGIALVRQWSADMAYRREDGRNHLVLMVPNIADTHG
jgi:anti-sigma regulatory factor (Ser/Thr protein kinase)